MTTTDLQGLGPGEPWRRCADDETADTVEVTENLRACRFGEWPNEAGYDTDEHQGPIDLIIKGDIPSWAAGTLYRTGPGASQVPGTTTGTVFITHWFDGLGHSHRFEMEVDGGGGSGRGPRIIYRSRRQSEALAERIRAAGRHPSITFGQRRDDRLGFLARLRGACVPALPGGSNVQVCVHVQMRGCDALAARGDGSGSNDDGSSGTGSSSNRSSTTWLSTDTATLLQMDELTLEPVQRVRQDRFHHALEGPMSASHGQRDPETGDFFNYNLTFGRLATYRVFRVCSATGTTSVLATICEPAAAAAYIHSFFLTAQYVVLCIPVAHYGLGGLRILWERNMLDALCRFDATQKTHWFVIDRQGGRGVIARFDSPANFFLHTVNAFEEVDDGTVDILADVVDYANYDILYASRYDQLLNRGGSADQFWRQGNHCDSVRPHLSRYRLRISGPETVVAADDRTFRTAQRLFSIPGPHAGEYPTVNPRMATRRHRYVYSCVNRGLCASMVDCLAKTDVDSREVVFWAGARGHIPGEPIFLPRLQSEEGSVRDDGGNEDDGALLSVVLDGVSRRSYLLFLDAKTMRELGRAECNFAIPIGFHGAHVKA